MVLHKFYFASIILLSFTYSTDSLTYLETDNEKCSKEDDVCKETNDCCKNLLCLEGICQHRCLDEENISGCQAKNMHCDTKKVCCANLVCNGICKPRCRKLMEDCADGCCSGLTCWKGRCQAPCRLPGQDCTKLKCCKDLECLSGFCHNPSFGIKDLSSE
jgi:hypothetical protein